MKKIYCLLLSCATLISYNIFADSKKTELSKPEYDVTVEAVIYANHDCVYEAIVNEYDGKTNWWQSDFSSKLLQGKSSRISGSIYEVTIHSFIPISFKTRTLVTRQGEMLLVEYFDGDFIGKGIWLFKDMGEYTKISLQWQTNPGSRYMRILSFFHSSVVNGHIKVMKRGFDRLNQYLAAYRQIQNNIYNKAM